MEKATDIILVICGTLLCIGGMFSVGSTYRSVLGIGLGLAVSLYFANLIANYQEVSFFIGGAYGFSSDFLRSLKTLSLSPLTLSHKIAQIVLCEQIYRALSIMTNHPYHK